MCVDAASSNKSESEFSICPDFIGKIFDKVLSKFYYSVAIYCDILHSQYKHSFFACSSTTQTDVNVIASMSIEVNTLFYCIKSYRMPIFIRIIFTDFHQFKLRRSMLEEISFISLHRVPSHFFVLLSIIKNSSNSTVFQFDIKYCSKIQK